MSYYANPHGHQCPWYPFAQAYGSPNIKWCEETLCQWVSEPANTWSNIAYILAAGYLLWRTWKSGQKELVWFAPAMFIMGLFSLIYHMSNFYISQVLDFVGMFLFVYWFGILNMFRIGWVKRNQLFPLLGILSVVSTIILHLMYVYHLRIQLIIGAAVAFILATEWKARKQSQISQQKKIGYKMFGTGLVFVAAAFIASMLDGSRVWCDPTNHWVQGHALWHILAAIGLTLAYHHYEQFDYGPKTWPKNEEEKSEE